MFQSVHASRFQRSWLAAGTLWLQAAVTLHACAPQSDAKSPTTVSPRAASGAALAPTPASPNDARGGRLYDNWRNEKKLLSFVADSSKTPELDGEGGPHSNGTLSDSEGKPLANTGHDYRLKNFFGWDLRGAEGIYGATFHNKPFAISVNLLTDTRTEAELFAWFKGGGSGLPAFGSVLSDADLKDLVAFVIKTRANALPRPEQIFRLDAEAPKNYALLDGGNAVRGKASYQEACSGCHGADGRNFPLDETESVGSLSRLSGYEVWFKIVNGQPGSRMGRMLPEAHGKLEAQAVLDVLAALCDRTAFPALNGTAEVPDGDARCGSYLK